MREARFHSFSSLNTANIPSKNAFGFEYFRVFSNEYGDSIRANVQARLAFDFDDSEDHTLALELHNTWIEKKLGFGTWIRAGHFFVSGEP